MHDSNQISVYRIYLTHSPTLTLTWPLIQTYAAAEEKLQRMADDLGREQQRCAEAELRNKTLTSQISMLQKKIDKSAQRAKKQSARQRTTAQAAPAQLPAEYAHGTGKRIVPHRPVEGTPPVGSEPSSATHSSDEDDSNSGTSHGSGTPPSLPENEGSPPHCRLSPDESDEQYADSPQQSLNAIDP